MLEVPVLVHQTNMSYPSPHEIREEKEIKLGLILSLILVLCIIAMAFPLFSRAKEILQPTIKYVSFMDIRKSCDDKNCCACYHRDTKTIIISDSLLCGVDKKGALNHEYIHYLVDVYQVKMSESDEEELAAQVGKYFSTPIKGQYFWENSKQSVKDNLKKLLSLINK